MFPVQFLLWILYHDTIAVARACFKVILRWVVRDTTCIGSIEEIREAKQIQ